MANRIESDDDLFGDDSDMSDHESKPKEIEQTESKDQDMDLFGEESDAEESAQLDKDIQDQEDEMQNVVEAHLPDLGGSKNNPDLYLIKLPNFLQINSKPFEAEKYLAENEFDEMDAGERLMIENTIRWRYNGNTPESNSRLIRWSNNTFSLLVGAELFDVGVVDVKARNLFLTNQFSEERFLKTQSR